MDLNFKLLASIDNLVKLSGDFDSEFKIMFNLDTEVIIDEEKAKILYSMTKNYILLRKEHGQIILMMNKLINSANSIEITNFTSNEYKDKKSDKNISKKNKNNNQDNNQDNNQNKTNILFDISTFSTLLNNVNDLINNIDYEYKKIAIKYPKFINKSQITIVLVSPNTDDKYDKLIEELKINNPEHKYKIIKCGNEKEDIKICEAELKELNIKGPIKSLPLAYIINNSTVSEIKISQKGAYEQIKNLIE
jgi:hypothetical protein